jgi:hypothetical protein
MPWRTEEDGTNAYIIWADLLVRDGYTVDATVNRLMGELAERHGVVGWGHTSSNPAGTDLEIELVDDHEDAAVRRSILELAQTTAGIERMELLDRDPLEPPPSG